MNYAPTTSLIQWAHLPKITDLRGDLTFIEGGRHVPFPIARVYYLYNVPAGADRGAHAHRELEQVLIAVAGRFRVSLDDGRRREHAWLDDPSKGLRVGRMIWREMDHFSVGAVCLVLASQPYKETDYFRRYGDFLAASGVTA